MQACICHLFSALGEGLIAMGKVLIWFWFSAGQIFMHNLHNVNKMSADARLYSFV
jgi:hypothetical protein